MRYPITDWSSYSTCGTRNRQVFIPMHYALSCFDMGDMHTMHAIFNPKHKLLIPKRPLQFFTSGKVNTCAYTICNACMGGVAVL